MPATVATPRPRVKPSRHVRWVVRPTAARPVGTVELCVGKDAGWYWVRRLPSDFGAAFELSKHSDGSTYHVLLSPDDGRHTCECKGFLRWNKCKHAEGLVALLAG